MDDVLHPLRCVYDVDVAGAPPLPAPRRDAPGHAEWRLLEQTRRVLDRWPSVAPEPPATEAVRVFAAAATEGASLDRLVAALGDPSAARPSEAVLAAVEARAADATLAAVRQVYGERADGSATGIEVSFLAPVRGWLDAAPRTMRPSAEVLAAIAVRAEEATRFHGTPDVEGLTPVLAPVAAAYGLLSLPDAGGTEAVLLAGARDAVSLQPRDRPDAATQASVLAAAARATAEARPAEARSPAARPSLAGERAPAVGSIAPARSGAQRLSARAWAGSAALAGALVIALVLLPRAIGTADVAETAQEAAAPEAPLVAEAVPPAPDALEVADASGEPAPSPAVSGPSTALAAPLASGIAAARRALPRPPAAPPQAASRETTPRTAAASFAPVVARTPSPAPADAWDAADNVRTLSMRVRALRQATPEAEWDAPAEAFGAPEAPMTMSATPGFQSVRSGAPARARVLSDSAQTGD